MTVGFNPNTGIMPGIIWIKKNPSCNAKKPLQYIPQTNYPCVPFAYLLAYTQPQSKNAPLTRDRKVMLFNSLPNEDKVELVGLSSDLMYGYYPVILGHLPAAPYNKIVDISEERMNVLKKYKKFFETKDIKLTFPRNEAMNEDFLVMVNVPEAEKVVKKNVVRFRKGLNNKYLNVKEIIEQFLDERNHLLDVRKDGSVNEEIQALFLGSPSRDAYFERLSDDAYYNRINKQEVLDKYKKYSAQDGDNPSPHTKILDLVCSVLDKDKYSTDGNVSNSASILIYYLLNQNLRSDITEEQKKALEPSMKQIDALLKDKGVQGRVMAGFYNHIYTSTWDYESKERYKSAGKRDIVNTIYAKDFDTAAKCFGYFLNN